jgi:hypothetical protein
MNAYELADHLESECGDDYEYAANMLRQQADRIAELIKDVENLALRNRQLESEVVGLLSELAKTEFDGGTDICPSCGCKSLYKTDKSEWCVTHKCLWQSDYETKPLSDEEILKLASNMFHYTEYKNVIEFARIVRGEK